MYSLVRPALFALDAGTAHALAMAALAPLEHVRALRAPVRALFRPHDPRLEVRTMGLVFPSPIGLAAGLDKNAERARALAAFGFGHLELGTVTAEAQGPNPPPNMFRLPRDRALVNRLGFPNEGASSVAARIAARKEGIGVPVGVSIGKSRSVSVEAALGDYLTSFQAVRGVADFVVVNVSSPNTKDLRALQAASAARPIFEALVAAGKASGSPKPILVKIAPDLPDESIDAICDEVMRAGLAGVVATNTTIARVGLETPEDEVRAIGQGGLSGKPLLARSLAVVKRARERLGHGPTIIGVGGIDGTESALSMLGVGADLVQLYTGLVYQGPTLAARIAEGFVRLMDREGAQSLGALVRAHPAPDAASPAVRSAASG